jgi:hypothetical protein
MMERYKQETGLTFGSEVEASSHDGEIKTRDKINLLQ